MKRMDWITLLLAFLLVGFGCFCIRSPDPFRPTVTSVHPDDTEEVVKARADLLIVEARNHKHRMELATAAVANRPGYEHPWPAYIIAGIVMTFYSLRNVN